MPDAQALNELLRGDAGGRDEYILQLEPHARPASARDLFAAITNKITSSDNVVRLPSQRDLKARRTKWAIALAACVTLIATGWWALRFLHPSEGKGDRKS